MTMHDHAHVHVAALLFICLAGAGTGVNVYRTLFTACLHNFWASTAGMFVPASTRSAATTCSTRW